MKQPNARQLATAMIDAHTEEWSDIYFSPMGVMKVFPDGIITVALRPPTAEEVDRFTY